MHETIARECCNFSGGKCIGGMFKFVSGEFVFWTDGNKANKKCLVTDAKICDWFENVVKYSIDKNYLLAKKLAAYYRAVDRRRNNGETEGV